MDARRVLLTGGTGFIGRALVQTFLQAGYRVTVFTRYPASRRRRMPPEVQLAPWKPDPEALRPWLEQADAVVNLVGANIAAGRWTQKRKAELYNSRVQAGRVLSQAWEKASPRPRVLLQMSAVGYYGNRGEEILTEESPPGTDFLARLCVDWEAATQPVEALGTRRVVMRTGIVLGRGGGALPLMALPVRLGLGGPLGDGRHYMPWIHLQDVVGAMRFFLEREETQGVYNLTAPHPVTNEEFVRTLARVLRRPAFFRVPAWVLRLVLGELAEALLASQRAIPARLLRAGYAFSFQHLEPALRDLLK